MSLLCGGTPAYQVYVLPGQTSAPAPAPARGFLGRLFGCGGGPAYQPAPVPPAVGGVGGVGLQKQLARPRAEPARPAAGPAGDTRP